ncbi:MAG: aldo/keto reductase [Actinobacteria bacterium]|nr:aldo/keto reductase [Actinomycetota bacterium]
MATRPPRFKDGNLGRNLALVEKVEEIAREKGVGVSQVALAWVLSRGEDVIPIPGTKRVKHLETNAAALDIEFTDEELERLDEAAPPGVAVGDRYPDMSSVNI